MSRTGQKRRCCGWLLHPLKNGRPPHDPTAPERPPIMPQSLDRLLLLCFVPLYLILLVVKINALQAPVSPYAETMPLEQTQARHKQTTTPPKQKPPLWHKIPSTLSMAALAFLVLWRSWQRNMARLFFVGLITLAIGELGPFGTDIEPHSALFFFNLGLDLLGSCGVGLLCLFCLRFPVELPVEKRWPSILALCVGCLDAIPRALNALQPTSGAFSTESLILHSDALVSLLFVVIATRNYWFSPPIGKIRYRWGLAGLLIGLVPWLLLSIISSLSPTWPYMGVGLVIAYLCYMLLPIGFLMAMLADDMLQIDGQSKLATLYVMLIVLLAACTQFAFPWLAYHTELHLGLKENIGRYLLTSSSVLAFTWFGVRQYTPLSHYFLPETNITPTPPETHKTHTQQLPPPKESLSLLLEQIEQMMCPQDLVALWRQEVNSEWTPLSTSTPTQQQELCDWYATHHETTTHIVLDTFEEKEPHQINMFLHTKTGEQALLSLGPKQSRVAYTETDVRTIQSMLQSVQERIQAHHTQQTLLQQQQQIHALQDAYHTSLQRQKEREYQFASINHDLKQPLESIRLLSEILEERALDEGSQTLLQDLRISALTLRSMIHQQLQESREQAQHETQFRLSSMNTSFRALFGPQAQQKGLEFLCELGDTKVYTDARLLERILHNLISNAIRYTSTGHVIVLSTEQDGHVLLCVEDTGCGFAPAQQQAAFEAWKQLASGSDDGHGLGLAIAYQLSKEIGTELSVQSTPEQGSTFCFSLPTDTATS
ncbi:MAG TPA: hypothetical protein DCE42_27255 [Myxococcales bacterium]|nr:hypothetical protein [Myxococcales bacterium]